MNAMPAAYAEFGQTLAFTERTTDQPCCADHLAQRDVEPETWYALKLVAVGGPDVARSSLVRDLEGSPRVGLRTPSAHCWPDWPSTA